MSLLAFFVARDLSFILTQIPVLILDSTLVVSSNSLLFFDVPLLCYIKYSYVNLKSSIIFCLFSKDKYLSRSICSSFVSIFSSLFCVEVFETVVIWQAILFPVISPVASAVLLIALFEEVFSASLADCLAWSRRFWLYSLHKFLLIFFQYFYTYF